MSKKEYQEFLDQEFANLWLKPAQDQIDLYVKKICPEEYQECVANYILAHAKNNARRGDIEDKWDEEFFKLYNHPETFTSGDKEKAIKMQEYYVLISNLYNQFNQIKYE